jgi:hypothetical protein
MIIGPAVIGASIVSAGDAVAGSGSTVLGAH